jgi:hypothetical protein
MGGLAGAVDKQSFHGPQARFLFARSYFEVPVNLGQSKKMQQVLILCEINMRQVCVHSAIACDGGQNRQFSAFGEAGRELPGERPGRYASPLQIDVHVLPGDAVSVIISYPGK